MPFTVKRLKKKKKEGKHIIHSLEIALRVLKRRNGLTSCIQGSETKG